MEVSSHYQPPDVSDEELAMLDVDLDRAWHGVMGEVWSEPVPVVERGARRILRSAALARVLVVSPMLILAWIIASAFVFALGMLVTQASGQPLIPLIAPALAAVGVAYAYGAGADVAWEISRTMPIPSRMILLVRLAVVFTISTLLGGIASLVTPALGGITALWLLPMVGISMLALAIATVTRLPVIGGGVALLVWAGIVMKPVLDQREERLVEIDLGRVVEQSTLAHQAPLWLAAIAICAVIVIWHNGAYSHTREDAPWQLR